MAWTGFGSTMFAWSTASGGAAASSVFVAGAGACAKLSIHGESFILLYYIVKEYKVGVIFHLQYTYTFTLLEG